MEPEVVLVSLQEHTTRHHCEQREFNPHSDILYFKIQICILLSSTATYTRRSFLSGFPN
jgi:hypothetical protein